MTGKELSWTLRVYDPTQRRTFWIRWGALFSQTGFRDHTQVHALLWQDGLPASTPFTSHFEKRFFKTNEGFSEASSGPCFFSTQQSKGVLHTKGETLEWELEFTPSTNTYRTLSSAWMFSFFEQETLQGAVQVKGVFVLNGQRITLSPNSLAHLSRGQGRQHVVESFYFGTQSFDRPEEPPFALEGVACVFKVGPVKLPPLIRFWVRYKNESFEMVDLWSSIRTKLSLRPHHLGFSLFKGNLEIKGHWHTPIKSLQWASFEDPKQTILYCGDTESAEVEAQVYRDGKLEHSFVSKMGSFLEHIRRAPPYAE